jgi:hypothetical protein
MRCDIVEADPEVVNEWRKGRYRGMSAGFVSDANGTNKRLGHVALLGAKSPALSQLPEIEIFSATACEPQLCFSTEPIVPKDNAMTDYAKLKNAHQMAAAAYAAAESGEPGHETKIAEAEKALEAACNEPVKDGPLDQNNPPQKVRPDDYGALPAAQAAMIGAKRDDVNASKPKNKKKIYKKSEMKGNWPTEQYTATDGDPNSDTQQEHDGVSVDDVLDDEGTLVNQEEIKSNPVFQSQSNEIASLKKAIALLTKINQTRDFEAKLNDLKSKGYVFNQADALEAFEVTGGNEKAVASLVKLLTANRRQSLVGGSVVDPQIAGKPDTSNFEAYKADGGVDAAVDLLKKYNINVKPEYVKIAGNIR